MVDGWRFKFRRGDANISGLVDVSDIQFIMNWLFNGGHELACWDATDVNDDGIINIADSVYLSKWLFQGGPPPPAPGPTTIAVDPTGDMFGCKTYPGGEIPW